MIRKGTCICYVHHLYQRDGQVMSYEEFCTQYHLLLFMDYLIAYGNLIELLTLMTLCTTLLFTRLFRIKCRSKKGSEDVYNEFIVIKLNQ